MPLAVVYTGAPGELPVVLSEQTDELLAQRIRSMWPNAPENLPLWLLSLPQPSRWFETREDAIAALDAMVKGPPPMTGEEVLAIRTQVGMSRAKFGAAIGLMGNANSRNKHVFEMEKGTKRVTDAYARRARALQAMALLP
jgi:DNA-binding transcriptional regulator YiaG